MDAAFVAADYGLNVRGEEGDGVLCGDGGVEPGGIMFVPAEIVAAGGNVMGFGEVHEEIGLGEVEAALFGMSGAPFHLVFGDEDRALVDDERGEVGATELRVGNGGAEEETFRMGDFAELGDFGGVR